MLLQDGRPGDTTEGNGVGTLPTGFAVGSFSFSLRKDLIRSVKDTFFYSLGLNLPERKKGDFCVCV